MGDASDFTFCQVGLPANDDHLESPKEVPNISKITLNENISNGASQDVNSSENGNLKSIGPGASPSNNNCDTTPQKLKLNESITPTVVATKGDTVNGSQEQRTAMKKPAVRAKVPFEKGYSQMDWLKLTRTDPDLAGLKGRSNRRLISMEEVKKHKVEGSIWTVLKGRVYNISPYMKFHPGGVDMLMKAAGKDSTALFNKYHAWVNFEFLLEKCLVGVLDENSQGT